MLTAIVWDNTKCFSEYIKQAASYCNSHNCHQRETDFINSMPALHVISPLKETGALKHVTNLALKSGLIPMWKIARREISPN